MLPRSGPWQAALILYGAGARLGGHRLRRIVDRLPLVNLEDLERAEGWFDHHGSRAVLLGRFVPVVPSLVSVPAGVERMPLVPFTVYTALGSAGYNSVLVLLGYLLGSQWQSVGQYSSYINYINYINYTILAAIAGAIVFFVAKRARRYSNGSYPPRVIL